MEILNNKGPYCGARALCHVICGAGGKFRFEYFGQNTTYIGCRQDACEFFMMKNDGRSDVTLCHFERNRVQRRVEGNNVRLINHDVASSDVRPFCGWQEPFE